MTSLILDFVGDFFNLCLSLEIPEILILVVIPSELRSSKNTGVYLFLVSGLFLRHSSKIGLYSVTTSLYCSGSYSLISLIIFLQIDVINNDGLLYLHTADVYTQSGLKAAIATYEWPFYSVLIAIIANFLTVSTAVVAYSLNAIL